MVFTQAHRWRLALGMLSAALTIALGGAAPVGASAEVHAAVDAVARHAPVGHALVLSVSAAPGDLKAWGGTVAVRGRTRNATSCQLVLLSRQSFPVIYSHNPTSACRGGNYAAHVTVGANPTYVQRLITFVLIARNARSSFSGRFYVLLASHVRRNAVTATTRPTITTAPPTTAPPTTAPPTTAPPTTAPPTTAPLTTTTRPTTTTSPSPVTVPISTANVPTKVESDNWSGYSVTGGPYAAVTGTFVVPKVTSAATCGEHVSEWVGLDGFSPAGTDNYLIQAGVDEAVSSPTNGSCNPGAFYMWPWWEVLPRAETPVDAWDNGTATEVRPGDQVTVTIARASGTLWSISITDRSVSGATGTFTTQQPYSGPAKSAEWVVEAPSSQSGKVLKLAPFGPAVDFTGLGVAGDQSALWEDDLAQDDQVVAAPSRLAGDGFSVAYTGASASPYLRLNAELSPSEPSQRHEERLLQAVARTCPWPATKA
ncbi:MAG: G1 family glutamic endopeptidase [Acidimicrobiales bacterium]